LKFDVTINQSINPHAVFQIGKRKSVPLMIQMC